MEEGKIRWKHLKFYLVSWLKIDMFNFKCQCRHMLSTWQSSDRTAVSLLIIVQWIEKKTGFMHFWWTLEQRLLYDLSYISRERDFEK